MLVARALKNSQLACGETKGISETVHQGGTVPCRPILLATKDMLISGTEHYPETEF